MLLRFPGKKINKKPETGKTLADEKKTYFAISRGKKQPKIFRILEIPGKAGPHKYPRCDFPEKNTRLNF